MKCRTKNCKEEVVYTSTKTCIKCYKKDYHIKKKLKLINTPCRNYEKCKNNAYHDAPKLCNTCYRKKLEKRINKKCKNCKDKVHIKKHQLCIKCYRQYSIHKKNEKIKNSVCKNKFCNNKVYYLKQKICRSCHTNSCKVCRRYLINKHCVYCEKSMNKILYLADIYKKK